MGSKMHNTFNSLELDLATEVINIGLAKAADSLSFFTHGKVLIRCEDLVIDQFHDKQLFTKSADNITILATQIRGQMTGYCYLIFNQQEVEQLYKLSFSDKILNNPEQLAEMGKAILMEVDNIITAAVVTQFSNLFKIEMHGYVPEHFSGNKQQVNDFIKDHASETNFYLHFNTQLTSKDQKIAPEFLWCLDESFVELVKTFVEQDENFIKLR